MKYLSRVFTPTRNRRLNELIGFLLIVSAILLFLALASYSPLDPSFNTATSTGFSHPAKNWIGIFGAVISDLLIQFIGISVFFVPVFVGLLGLRWFRSRGVACPVAKTIGAMALLFISPALPRLVPWELRRRPAVPLGGILGRIVGDALIHYFNI